MNIPHSKLIVATVAGMMSAWAAAPLHAQDTGVDLAAQRSEIQIVKTIPGVRVDHRGFVVNPTPQRMALTPSQRLDVSGGVRVKDKKGRFGADTGFLPAGDGRVRLTVDFGGRAARKAGVRGVSGAYVLRINEKGITITGYDERGAFYGLQTLRQLLASPGSEGGSLPCGVVNDWPSLPNRGVVEGFYGTPWSHQARLSLIDFYGRFKMNAYLYGPKDDPYHSSPNWREPYPADEAAQIKELIEACERARVDFVWAIHPGKDIKWNEEDYGNLVRKFNLMYDLGVRHFALFFDDISGEGANPERQTALLNRLTDDFVRAKGDVSPLTVCPTEYTRLWANPGPRGSLITYGRELYPEIKVLWTGDAVCSDLTRETLGFVNPRIQRPAYYWWNFPVTDYARQFLLQGPTYGLTTGLTADDVSGVVSNPMEHAEASKLALYGVADYAWNTTGYNPIDNWERGLHELVPDATEAYRTFAIHSGDTETGYRRDESWETPTFRLADWQDAAADSLEAEFRRIEAVPAALEAGCPAPLLGELRPWLKEFGKLGTRGRRAVELGRLYREGNDDATFWARYVDNLMTPADRQAYEAHKSGSLRLQPFYEHIMDDTGHGFLTRLLGTTPNDYKAVGSARNITTVSSKLMLDHDSTTFYTTGVAQREGDWIGVDLRTVRDVAEVSILQGRNSVDDVDFFDHATLEASEDGKTWQTLIGEMKNQYVIHWTGPAVRARYVRLRRLDSKRTNWAAVRSFDVNPLHADSLGFVLEAADTDEALFAFDRNLATSYEGSGTLSFGVAEGTKAYTLLMRQPVAALSCKQYDADGGLLAETALTTPYVRLDLADGAVRVSLEGKAEIFEIVAHQ